MGSTDEITEFKGSVVAITAAVCTGGGEDMTETDVDTSWAS